MQDNNQSGAAPIKSAKKLSLSREVVSVIAVRTGVRAGQKPRTDTSCGTQCSDTKAGGSCGVCNF